MMGNCGVGIAPCRPAARAMLTEDLVTVEGIDHQVLTEGIHWDFETFPQFMDAAAKRGSAINLGFMVPLAPLRTYTLGAAANERAATDTESISQVIVNGRVLYANGRHTGAIPGEVLLSN
jgi:N-acyl-D-amino-acid deacylase